MAIVARRFRGRGPAVEAPTSSDPDRRRIVSAGENQGIPMKAALVCGGGGFIGAHLVKRLKREGFWVRAVDLKFPQFSETEADDFIVADLNMSVLEGSIGALPRRVLVDSSKIVKARYILTGAGIGHVIADDNKT